MRTEAEIVREIRSAFTNGGDVDVSELLNEFYLLGGDVVSRGIRIENINLESDIRVRLGEVRCTFFFGNLTGLGSLVVHDSCFRDSLSIQRIDNYNGKRLAFEKCEFFGVCNLGVIKCPELSLVFSGLGCESKLHLNIYQIKVKRIYLRDLTLMGSKCNALRLDRFIGSNVVFKQDIFATLSFDTELKSLFLKKCDYDVELRSHADRTQIDFVFIAQDTTFPKGIGLSTRYLTFRKSFFLSNRRRKNINIPIFSTDGATFAKIFQIRCGGINLLSMRGSQFLGRCFFRCDELRQFDVSNVEFAGVDILSRFEKFKMSDSSFSRDSHFDGCKFQSVEMSGCKFSGYTSFKRTVFSEAPVFSAIEFTHDTTFHGAIFKDTRSKESEGRYRALKEYMRKISNDSDEILFSSYEIESRQKELWATNKLEYLFSLLYQVSNSYGRSIGRPILNMIFVWIVFFFVYLVTDSIYVDVQKTDGVVFVSSERDFISPGRANPVAPTTSWTLRAAQEGRAYKAAVFSGINMLGPLRLVSFFEGFKVTYFRYVLITWFQSIVATILWYLFIVGVKRRFRTG